jgi:uncharacterized protein (DUF1778 family)
MAQPPTHAQDALTTTDSTSREARLEIRLTREQKSLVTRAAAARGATVADFVRQAVQDAAALAVTEYDLLRLCVEDQEALAAALLAEREPSAELKATYEEYRERIGA